MRQVDLVRGAAILFGLAVLPASFTTAKAAALRAATTGCKAPADAEKVAEFERKGDQAALNKLARPKIGSGDCLTFARGVAVTADIKKPPLTCVRLSGGLDCYWVSADLVNLNPAEPETRRGAAHGGGRRR